MKVREEYDAQWFEIRLKRGDHLDKLIGDPRLCKLLTTEKDSHLFHDKWRRLNPENHFTQDVIITVEYDIKKARRK